MSVRAPALLGLLTAIVGTTAGDRAAHADTPGDRQLALAGAGAVKLAMRGEGWIRVGQPALVAAGLSPSVDPARIQVFTDGIEQPIRVTGDGDPHFTADEAIELWSVGRDTAWSDTRTYWLVAGDAGARIPLETPAPAAPLPASFTATTRLVERNIYLASIRNGDLSNFFGAAVSTTPTLRALAAHHLDAGHAGDAVLRVTLQGVTATAHAVDVLLNGARLGTATFDNQSQGTFTFPASGVVEGDNQVALTSGTANDYAATVSLELDYPHLYAADDDAFVFTAPAATRVAVSGFSTADVRILDVTDANHPIELAATVTPAAAGNTAEVDVPPATGIHRLYAFTGARVGAPAGVTADAPSTWAASHDGELLILSHAAFLDSLAPLVARRAQEGWSVQLVDVQDAYDEQGFGDKSPDAIRAFLRSARANWRVPPRFVLLVGDATFDPRNFLGKGDFDFMPTRLIDTAGMETASDDWFVDDDLDGVPELAIGRLPVRTRDQATAVVQKLLGYAGKADLARGGLFVTDTDGVDLDFSAASAAAAAKVSDILPIDRFQRDTSGTPSDFLNKLNDGPFLVNYLGHGSVEVWDGLLTSAQAAGLTNSHPSIYVVMNCLNGFFHDLYTTSLAESLLTAPQGGAVAVWASSTLAEFTPQPAFNQEFLMRVSRTSLGEAAIAAKSRTTDPDTRRTWMLFGDPTLFGAPAPMVPPADAGTDATATDAGTDAPAVDAASDAGSSDDAGPDASAPDAATDVSAPEAGRSPDGGADAAVAPDAGGRTDAGADATASLASRDGCGCSEGGASGFGPAGLGLTLLGLIAGARRSRRRRARIAGIAAVVLAGLAWASQAEAAYGYRMAITIDRTRIGTSSGATTLSNYPLLLDLTSVNLATAANGGHVQNASGYDISFQGADTTTCGGPATCTFNYEIESYTASSGRVIAWVDIPTLKTTANTANTVIYVKYGDASVMSATQNQTGTWDTNFKGVWHLNQSSSPQSDSTSTPANASQNGSPAVASVTGLIGSGVSTSSTTGTAYLDYRSTKFDWTASDTFTYQGWFNTTDGSGPLFAQRDTGGSPVIDINLGYNGATTNTNKMSVLVRDNTGGTYAQVNGSTALNDNSWHHFAVTRSSGTIEVYVDGSSIGSATGSGASGAITTGSMGTYYQNIGREGNWVNAPYGTADQQYLAATFDEFRISNTIRAAEWIKTDYNTQGTPGSTYSLGGEQLASCGDGSVGTGETCDDGNFVSGDGCSNACAVESGYTCSGTPSSCHTTCGDGVVAGSEACDDSGTANGDGCSSTCTLETGYHCTGSPSSCTLARFDYYKTITIDATKVGTASAPTTLSNYPVLVSLSDSSLKTTGNGGRVRNSNGYDIIFQAVDSTTCSGAQFCGLAHQVEKYDGVNGILVAWVNVPVLKTQTYSPGSNTSFRMLIGNSVINTANTTTERITSVWDSSFTGVWHLNQAPSGSGAMTDATSNANHGTPTSVSTQSSGQVASGVTMDGSTSYIAMNSGTTLNTATSGAFTYSTWFKFANTEANGGLFSLRSSTQSNVVIDIMIGMDGASTSSGALMALVRDDANGGQNDIVSASTVNNSTWHLVELTHSGTSMQLYLDGASVNTKTVSSGAFTTDIRNLGREGRWVQDSYTTTANTYFAGDMDEARASNVARDADWIITDYNNQSSPSTFLTGYVTGSGGEVTTSSTTAVDLVSLAAAETCTGTTIAWQMAQGFDTLGFNVFREVGGERTKLNSSFIGQLGVSGAGERYAFIDPGPRTPGRVYWIENVTLSLESRWYGPATPLAAPGCDALVPPGGSTPGPAPIVTAGGPAPQAESVADQTGGCSVADSGVTRSASIVMALIGLALVIGTRRSVVRSRTRAPDRPPGPGKPGAEDRR